MRTLFIILAAVIGTFIVVWGASQFVIHELVVPVDCNFHSVDSGEACAKAKELAMTRSGIMIGAVGMVAGVVSTIALVVTIYYTSTATKAATQAVKAANRALDHSEHVADLQLRPYLILSRCIFMRHLDNDSRLTHRSVAAEWKNEGQTPARAVASKTVNIIVDNDLPEDFAFPWAGEAYSISVVGPATGMTAYSDDLISLEDVQAVIDGRKHWYMYGWTEYQGTEPGARYRSETAVLVLPHGASSADDLNLEFTTRTRTRHNGIDEGCMYGRVTPHVAPTKAAARSS